MYLLRGVTRQLRDDSQGEWILSQIRWAGVALALLSLVSAVAVVEQRVLFALLRFGYTWPLELSSRDMGLPILLGSAVAGLALAWLSGEWRAGAALMTGLASA